MRWRFDRAKGTHEMVNPITTSAPFVSFYRLHVCYRMGYSERLAQ